MIFASRLVLVAFAICAVAAFSTGLMAAQLRWPLGTPVAVGLGLFPIVVWSLRSTGRSGKLTAELEECHEERIAGLDVQESRNYALRGRIECDEPLVDPLTGQPVAWYRFRRLQAVEEFYNDLDGDQQSRLVTTTLQETRDARPFRIVEGEGRIEVNPVPLAITGWFRSERQGPHLQISESLPVGAQISFFGPVEIRGGTVPLAEAQAKVWPDGRRALPQLHRKSREELLVQAETTRRAQRWLRGGCLMVVFQAGLIGSYAYRAAKLPDVVHSVAMCWPHFLGLTLILPIIRRLFGLTTGKCSRCSGPTTFQLLQERCPRCAPELEFSEDDHETRAGEREKLLPNLSRGEFTGLPL